MITKLLLVEFEVSLSIYPYNAGEAWYCWSGEGQGAACSDSGDNCANASAFPGGGESSARFWNKGIFCTRHTCYIKKRYGSTVKTTIEKFSYRVKNFASVIIYYCCITIFWYLDLYKVSLPLALKQGPPNYDKAATLLRMRKYFHGVMYM